MDGVLLIAEHGNYPVSDTGQVVYPKRRMFEQIAATFRASGRSAPVFIDKHLADNWTDAKWIYDTAKELNAPLMAGSSLPVLWRYPPDDVRRGAKLKEIVAVSYHTLDAYGFHALEIVQALAERRAGGETGVASVQCLTGKAVWEAEKSGVYDRRLLDDALSRLKERPLPPGKKIEELVSEPVLFVINYRDGLRANVFTLNHAVGEWAAAWRYAGHEKNNEKKDGESAVGALLDAGSPALHALRASALRRGKNDADGQTDVAGRADTAHQRRSRRAIDFQAGRRKAARHAVARRTIRVEVGLASAASAAAGPADWRAIALRGNCSGRLAQEDVSLVPATDAD